MIFTYLTIQDLISRAGKEVINDLPSLAQELELKNPKDYQYRLVLRFMIEEDESRSRRIKVKLFKHILEVLEIKPFEISDRFIEQEIIV